MRRDNGLRQIAGLVLALSGSATAASAQSGSNDIVKTHRGEAWAGVEATRKNWTVYTGATWAPFGPLHDSGFRVRAIGGIGSYSYRTTNPELDPNALAFGDVFKAASILLGTGTSAQRSATAAQTAQVIKVKGQTRFADVLAGYQWSQGDLTLKAFAGASFVVDTVSPADPNATWTGTFEGAKIVAEAWYNINPSLWTAIDLNYTTIAQTHGARTRVGWRVLPHWSIGLDAGARRFDDGYENVLAARIGALVRYEWNGRRSEPHWWPYLQSRHPRVSGAGIEAALDLWRSFRHGHDPDEILSLHRLVHQETR